MKNYFSILLAIASIAVASPSLAIGLGDLTGKKEPAKESATEQAGLDSFQMQDRLVKQYLLAAGEINAAQLLLAQAFGLKDFAAQLEAESKVLAEGSVTDKDAMERRKELSLAADEAIRDKMKAKAELSEDGLALYAKSFLPYLRGLVESKKIVDEAVNFMNSASQSISSASFTKKMSVTSKLKPGMFVAKETPTHAARLFETSKMMLTYAKSSNIDVPADATDQLAGLF